MSEKKAEQMKRTREGSSREKGALTGSLRKKRAKRKRNRRAGSKLGGKKPDTVLPEDLGRF